MRRVLALLALALLSGCVVHSRATHWNGHVGPDGEPVFVLSSSYLGANLGVLLPVLGKTTIDEMVNESTSWIREREGSHLRLVETETNNYWYGVPPLTWFISPVITSVTFEYRPSQRALAIERRRNGEVVELRAQPPR